MGTEQQSGSWLLSNNGDNGVGSWVLSSNGDNGAGSWLLTSNGDNGAGSWLLTSNEHKGGCGCEAAMNTRVVVVAEQQWVARGCRPAMETSVGGSWLLLNSTGDYDAMGLGRSCQRAMETVSFAAGYLRFPSEL